MPAVSQKQQKFMNWVHAVQKGEAKGSSKVKAVAKDMKPSSVEHFMGRGHINKKLPDHIKKAFLRGFMKRANEWHVPSNKAKEMFANLTFDKQLDKKANLSETLDNISNALFPHSKDSLFDVANDAEAGSAGSKHKTLREIGAFANHMANNALPLTTIGAGAGALHGWATTKKDGDKLKRTGKHGLLGGLLGFGVGAGHDAYHLGDNTKNQLVDSYQQQKNHLSTDDFLNQNRMTDNIDKLKKSYWFEHYNPDHIERKLK